MVVQESNHAIWMHVFTKKELVIFRIIKNVLDLQPLSLKVLLFLVYSSSFPLIDFL